MKEETHNEYNKAINRVIDYVNAHLQENIDLKKMAELSHLSEYHFHRIFNAYIGESVGAYINRLRVEYAANLLRKTEYSLSEIADQVGYSSQQALSKAFKNHFDITPKAFRNIESFFSSKQTRSRVNTLNLVPQIEEQENKKLIYLRVIADYDDEVKSIKAFEKLFQFASNRDLIGANTEVIGIGFDDPTITKKDRCRYYACLTIDKDVTPDGEVGVLTIPKGKYAVFTVKGSHSQLDNIYDFIFSKWLDENEFELADTYAQSKPGKKLW
jgi:AraC family transcriptional regulator